MSNYILVLLDGPARGELVAVPDPNIHHYVVAQPRSINLLNPDPLEPLFNKVVYKITRLKMFGELLLVGSVNERPSDHDLFEALASNDAKTAALR